MFCTYIIYSESKNRYYVGSTSSLEDRLERHNGGRSKATKAGVPWMLVFRQSFSTRSEAVKVEMKIKRMKSRESISRYVHSEKNELSS